MSNDARMLPVEPPAPVDDREELRMMVSALRRHLQWKARAGIRVIAKGRPAGTGPKTMTPINAELFSAAAAAPEARTLEELRDHIGDCRRCKLWSGRTHLVFGVGNPRETGRPFVGKAGELLTKILAAIELPREQVFICNVVKCRPPENRNPEPDEVESCEPFLKKQIELVQPKVIVALGKFAVQSLLQSKQAISRLRGQWHDYQGVRLMPTFHPAYLLRNPGDKKLVWEDIKKVIQELKSR